MGEHNPEESPRQRIVRVTGSRRARLTAVAGTDTSPDVVTHKAPAKEKITGRGPNDDRMLGDVPPHY
ncbi:hypothetical protein ACSS7Z_11580 [Microbacterium sp. A82]|uniref:hypothetical protein n=1 Tax=unclassified Microbacterium TaxID=2609290 RepID=UPI003F339B8B